MTIPTTSPADAAPAMRMPLPVPVPRPVPWRELAPWAAFGTLMALLALYLVGAEQGATSLVAGHGIHEFVHDGRHLLGFPCH